MTAGATSIEELRDTLAGLALERGFDGAGWAGAGVRGRDAETLRAWLERGMQAGMGFMQSSLARRLSPGGGHADSVSVLTLAVSHAHPEPGVPKGGTRVGRVARYAWSRDYHEVLQPHLASLVEAAAKMGVRARAHVDHAPVLERSFAIRAGIGWRGRSSQVVSTNLGAYTTLAVVVTDLPAPEAEAGHPDRCGTCSRCVVACPTAAITPDGLVDARRCLSYYTIEHRGEIPDPYRAGLGDHLFGCDECLSACPWSVKAGPLARMLEADPELAHPDVESFFTLSGHAFLRRYEGTAFARPRRRGMARNAALVIGNSGRTDTAWLLELGLADAGEEVRLASAWAAGRLAAPLDGRLPAFDKAARHQDDSIRAAACAGNSSWTAESEVPGLPGHTSLTAAATITSREGSS